MVTLVRMAGRSRLAAPALIGALLVGASNTAGAAPPPRAPRAAQSRIAPRVLVYYDMEGISGIVRAKQVLFPQPDYQAARRFLTGDVNAAIAGLKAGGAGDIVVTDAHGSGNDEPDVLLPLLDKRATFMFKDHRFDPYIEAPDSSFQAIVCIGMHARAGTQGFMAHTVTVEPTYRVNDRWLTETSIVARSAARFGIPVIMVSGDDVLRGQIHEEFPDVEYAVVKTAEGRAHAKALPLAEAQGNIRRAAEAAIKRLDAFKPLSVEPAYRFEVSYLNKLEADLAAAIPGTTRTDSLTLAYTAPDFISGFEKSAMMTGAVGLERLRLMAVAVRRSPAAKQIMGDYLDLILLNWLEPEKMPKAAPSRAAVKKRYHGDS